MAPLQAVTMPSEVWRQHYATAAGARWWPCEELVRAMSRHDLSRAAVLEVGCGNGSNLWFLAEQAALVVGIDLIRQPLTMARTHLAQRGRAAGLAQADLPHLPLKAGAMSGVVDVMTSQHVDWIDHAHVYAEYHRVLAPGGWLFLYLFRPNWLHLGE